MRVPRLVAVAIGLFGLAAAMAAPPPRHRVRFPLTSVSGSSVSAFSRGPGRRGRPARRAAGRPRAGQSADHC